MALPVTISSVAMLVDARVNGGPFISSAGNVYIVLLDLTDRSIIEVVKATDPTVSFSKQDTAHHPNVPNLIDSLEAYQVSDVLHIAVQEDPTFRVSYYTFNMATDLWAISEEVKASIVTGRACVSIAVRSDGDVIIGYVTAHETITMSDFERTAYARREGGSWTVDIELGRTGVAGAFKSLSVVRGANDRMHFVIADKDNVTTYQRTLLADNTLEAFPAPFDSTGDANSMSVGAGVSYVSGGVTKIRVPFRDGDGKVSIAKFDSTDTPTVTVSAGISTALSDSSYPISLAVKGTTLYAFWVEDSTLSLYRDQNVNDAGWGTDVLEFNVLTICFCVNVLNRGGVYKLAYCHYGTNLEPSAITKYNEIDLGSVAQILPIAAHRDMVPQQRMV